MASPRVPRAAAAALALLLGARAAAAVPLDVAFNTADASYAVRVGGATWFNSSVYGIHTGGAWATTALGNLTLAGVTPVSGAGQFGAYTGWASTWDAPGAPGVWQTTIFVYGAGAIVFEQAFPKGLAGTAVAGSLVGDVCTSFPSFGPTKAALDTGLAYLTFEGGHTPPHVGRWTAAGARTAGGEGGAVTAWWNASNTALVLSALTDVETQWGGFSGQLGGVFAQGFNGALSGIPPGWRAQSLLVAGDDVARAFYAWGDLMLAAGGKTRTGLTADPATAFLSAWTDNGAYYYYNVEPNTTAQQTMLDYLAYIRGPDAALPVRSLQFDSYWYFKRAGDTALLLWEPMPSVFPSGMAPWPGVPLALHNRFFADVNNYTEMGRWEFIVEHAAGLSLPVDKGLFTYIMGRAKAWGMTMYEQDWINRVWTGMRAPHVNITTARDWLHAMGDAATELGLTIQYCLVEPAAVLASASIPAVTNIRASGDSHPGDYHDRQNHWNTWDIALTSLFIGALGAQPSADTFWTSEFQPGNPYNASPSGDTEPNSFLHTLAATLSTGPVGFGDGIGYANASLLMRTCRGGDGLILKPDRPAHATQSALNAIFAMPPGTQGSFILPNVTHTVSSHGPPDGSQRWVWHYVLAVSLPGPFPLLASDLGPAFNASQGGYVVLDYFNLGGGAVGALGGAAGPGSYAIPPGQGLPSAPDGAHDVRYLLVAPVLPGGWVLVGEAAKLVPMSSLRTANLTASESGFTASVLTSPPGLAGPGGAGDAAVYLVIPPSQSTPVRVACPDKGGATAVLSCSLAGGCACE